jgi:hypothetical protein
MISGAGVVRFFHARAICHALATLGLGPSWRNGFTQMKCSVGGPELGWGAGPQGVMAWGHSQDSPNRRTSAMAPVLADSIIFIPLTILRYSIFLIYYLFVSLDLGMLYGMPAKLSWRMGAVVTCAILCFVGCVVFVNMPAPEDVCAGEVDSDVASGDLALMNQSVPAPFDFSDLMVFTGNELVSRELEIRGNFSDILSSSAQRVRPPLHCPAHGYRFRETPLALFEGVLFNVEVDMLEAHLEESFMAVDAFVVVESPYTFQGNPKPLVFKNHLHRFAKYRHKIIHVMLPSRSDSDVQQERDMRNAIAASLNAIGVGPDSVLITSDADEIVALEKLWILKFCEIPNVGTFHLKFFYYSLHYSFPVGWFAVHWAPLASISADNTPDILRFGPGSKSNFVLHDAGWHCSFFGDEAFIANKLHSYAPGTDLFKGLPYDNPAYIRCAIRHGRDIFGRPGAGLVRVDTLDGPYAFYAVSHLRNLFLLW